MTTALVVTAMLVPSSIAVGHSAAQAVTPLRVMTTSSTAADDVPDPDLKTECLTHPEAGDLTGWLKSRFEACYRMPVEFHLTGVDGSNLGILSFNAWLLAFAYDGSRRVDYVLSIEDITAAPEGGTDPSNWAIKAEFSHQMEDESLQPGNPGGGAITPPSDTVREGLLADWKRQSTWVATYSSPDSGADESAAGNYQATFAQVQLLISLRSAATEDYLNAVGVESDVRFDTAGLKAGKTRGTVFPRLTPVYQLSLADAAVRRTARHISDALEHPVSTFPSLPGKQLSVYLSRTFDSDLIDRNRAAAGEVCKDVWGDYDGQRLNCDEYPFASTTDGAANAKGRFSARLIDAADNQEAGRRLLQMYTLNRVLDGEDFEVRITP